MIRSVVPTPLRTTHDARFFLEVDGGITKQTIAAAHQAGADTFVAGHAVFRERRPRAGSAGAAPPLHGDGMTNRQQWTLIAGVVMTAVFGVALAIKAAAPTEPGGDRVAARRISPPRICARTKPADHRRLSRQGCAAQHLGDVVPALAARKCRRWSALQQETRRHRLSASRRSASTRDAF